MTKKISRITIPPQRAGFAMSFFLVLCMIAGLQVSAKAESQNYIMDTNGVWYMDAGDTIKPVGSQDPFNGATYVIQEPEQEIQCDIAQGNVRLTWRKIEGAKNYVIQRRIKDKTTTGFETFAHIVARDQPACIYDLTTRENNTYEYQVLCYENNKQLLKTLTISADITQKRSGTPQNKPIEVTGVSFKNNVLTIHYKLPEAAVFKGAKVRVTTLDNKTLTATTNKNITINITENTAELTFNNSLIKGAYIANIKFDIWGEGYNRYNPYTSPSISVNFKI